MGVAGLLRGNLGQQNSLLVMGQHMPDEGLVDGRIPTDPRQFAIVGGEERKSTKEQDSGNGGQAPYLKECPSFECPTLRGRATEPGE